MNASVEHDAIIAGADPFGTVGEQHLTLTVVQNRQKSHISQLAYARSAQVHVAETNNHTVGLVVARAPIPAPGMLIRTQLYHSKRHVGTHKHMSVATSSNSRIY